jgi:hypothetical protein
LGRTRTLRSNPVSLKICGENGTGTQAADYITLTIFNVLAFDYKLQGAVATCLFTNNVN